MVTQPEHNNVSPTKYLRLMGMNFFLIFQIKINATYDCDKRHKTKHNQCSHIISLSLFYLVQAKGRYQALIISI